MLGKYFPTELYPQPFYALDYIQHLIDKGQRKKKKLLSLALVTQGLLYVYSVISFLWPARQSFFFSPIASALVTLLLLR